MLPTDLRLAWRTLRRSPLFLAVAIVILTVGTGGIATSFSVLDAFLLAPLPYRDADRLVHLYRTDPQTGADALRFSLPMVEELRSSAGAMEALGAYSYGGANLAGGEGEPEHVMAAWLTTDLLALLGTAPALGRGFVAADGEASSPRVALLDWGLWRRRFGGRPEIVGETIHLDGEAHQVIGVMGAGFGFPYGEIRVWTPARPSDPAFTWGNQAFQPVARLAAGVARGEARAALETLYRQVEEARTGIEPDHGIRVVPLSRRCARRRWSSRCR